MSRVAVTVFDFDDTLVDESKIFEEAVVVVCKAIELEPPNRRMVKILATQHPEYLSKTSDSF